MNQWSDLPIRSASLVFFDLETTGLRPDRGGRISEMAVVDREAVEYVWASEQPPPSEEEVSNHLPQLLNCLQDAVVVGHNLQFDFRFLTYEAERLGHGGIDLLFVDTLGLSRKILPELDNYQLDELSVLFDLVSEVELHTAVGDALATRALFWYLVKEGDLETLSDANMKRLSWNAF